VRQDVSLSYEEERVMGLPALVYLDRYAGMISFDGGN
jgi:hypothetical protein